jgi:spermidine synthase
MFNAREARKNLVRYRKKGLNKIERKMVGSVSADVLKDARVLEIGGGVGAMQAELLKSGAERGEIVELVSAYEPYALELARENGIEHRTAFRVADVLDEPETVSRADVVVMNRVVCCSPDGVRLTAVAAGLARRMLLLSHPRDRFLTRMFGHVMNTTLRLLGKSFRVFLHSRDSIHAAAQSEGFVVAETGRGIVWEFVAFRRTA